MPRQNAIPTKILISDRREFWVEPAESRTSSCKSARRCSSKCRPVYRSGISPDYSLDGTRFVGGKVTETSNRTTTHMHREWQRPRANRNSQQHLGRTWCTSLVPKVPRLTTRPENSPRRSPPWVWMAATRSLGCRIGHSEAPCQ